MSYLSTKTWGCRDKHLEEASMCFAKLWLTQSLSKEVSFRCGRSVTCNIQTASSRWEGDLHAVGNAKQIDVHGVKTVPE